MVLKECALVGNKKKMDAFYSQFRLNDKPIEITPNDGTPHVFEKAIYSEKREKYTI